MPFLFYLVGISMLQRMTQRISQSYGLSARHQLMRLEGKCLIDDSYSSEETLSMAMNIIVPYAREQLSLTGWSLEIASSISLFECQTAFHKVGGPPPDEKNKKYYFKTDAPILMATRGDECCILSMIEDKVQGSNDTRFKQGLSRQSTGNAIERAAKNMRAAEMRTCSQEFFPYILFASGCDFHRTETISKRIDIMNYGFPPHYMEVTPASTGESVAAEIDGILSSVSVKKIVGKSIANVFIKAHKWDEMDHGASNWTVEDRVKIIRTVIDRSIESLPK